MSELLPCPLCGNDELLPCPFCAFTAVLRRDFGAEIQGAAARTVHQEHELPAEPEPLASPAEPLVVRNKDGDIE